MKSHATIVKLLALFVLSAGTNEIALGADAANLLVTDVATVSVFPNTTTQPGNVVVTNRMGSVKVSGASYFYAYLGSAGSPWTTVGTPPTASSIQFPLGYDDGTNRPARSGVAFACLQLAYLAKDMGYKFAYGSSPYCTSTNTGPPVIYAWHWNTFETNIANNGVYSHTSAYQVAGASYYSVNGAATAWTVNPNDFCGVEYNSSTHKWFTVSSLGLYISTFDSSTTGPALLNTNCGTGLGLDSKAVFALTGGSGHPEGNTSGLTTADNYLTWGVAPILYLKLNNMSLGAWGCFTRQLDKLKAGTFTTLSPGCL